MRTLLAAIALLVSLPLTAEEWLQQSSGIGDFTLDSGQVIRNCRIGYRTTGTLNAERSNVIVLTTWFAGDSSGLSGWIGAGNMFDPSRDYIIAVDALGDGVSSSPSNSAEQPRLAFPTFTITDMVRSQHELLTRVLKVDRVRAVAGLSMGGMQALQWVVSYPDYMEKVVAVVPTPKQTANDILLWQTELDLLESFRDDPAGLKKAMNAVAGMQALEIRTPSWVVRNVTDAQALLATHRNSLLKRDPFDYMAQLRAMIAHDIYRAFGGDVALAAKALRAKLMIVVALQDEMVNPTPARELARVAGAEIVTLSGDCGHLASACERDVMLREVWRFLAR